MATVLYLVLDRENGELAFASAGHPPPLVLAADGARASSRAAARSRSAPSSPAVVPRGAAVLPPGAALLLYTDGLVERRDEPLERRLDALADAAAGADDGLEGLCDAVLASVIGLAHPSDDVALLAVRPRRWRPGDPLHAARRAGVAAGPAPPR